MHAERQCSELAGCKVLDDVRVQVEGLGAVGISIIGDDPYNTTTPNPNPETVVACYLRGVRVTASGVGTQFHLWI